MFLDMVQDVIDYDGTSYFAQKKKKNFKVAERNNVDTAFYYWMIRKDKTWLQEGKLLLELVKMSLLD